MAEDRNLFSALLDRLGICQPKWQEVASKGDALHAAETIGFPILVRPSFVLSGKAMRILETESELTQYLTRMNVNMRAHPLVISQFIPGAIEVDVDGIAKNGKIVRHALSEHIEGGGVHSGDSVMVFPPHTLSEEMQQRLVDTSRTIVSEIGLNGAFNLQFLIKADTVYVIECNARASRSMPLVSKALDDNFMDAASRVFLGKTVKRSADSRQQFYTVKAPYFSFQKLRGADPVLHVEMSSTGEVAAMGHNLYEAFLTAIIASGVKLPEEKRVFLSLGGVRAKVAFLTSAQRLFDAGFTLYATSGTHLFLKEHKIESTRVGKLHEGTSTRTVEDLIDNHRIDFLVVIPEKRQDHRTMADYEKTVTDGYRMRRRAVDLGLPIFTNVELAEFFVEAVVCTRLEDLPILPLSAYTKSE